MNHLLHQYKCEHCHSTAYDHQCVIKKPTWNASNVYGIASILNRNEHPVKEHSEEEEDLTSLESSDTKPLLKPLRGGRWSADEHERFLVGFQVHGHKWKRVQQVVKTRTVTQVRTHAQKYLLKQKKLQEEGKGDKQTVKDFSANKPNAYAHHQPSIIAHGPILQITKDQETGRTRQILTPVELNQSPLEVKMMNDAAFALCTLQKDGESPSNKRLLESPARTSTKRLKQDTDSESLGENSISPEPQNKIKDIYANSCRKLEDITNRPAVPFKANNAVIESFQELVSKKVLRKFNLQHWFTGIVKMVEPSRVFVVYDKDSANPSPVDSEWLSNSEALDCLAVATGEKLSAKVKGHARWPARCYSLLNGAAPQNDNILVELYGEKGKAMWLSPSQVQPFDLAAYVGNSNQLIEQALFEAQNDS